MTANREKRRGRTGCRTCRIRRVKCDEDRPVCQRCCSTGRVCDGYEVPSAATRETAQKYKGKRLLQPQILGNKNDKILSINDSYGLDLSAAESTSFDFFRCQSAREIPGYFISSVWEQLVLQLSHREPCILHAAVAVGAMHRFSRGQCPSLLTGSNSLEPANAFAIRQYVKSLNHLRSRLAGSPNESCGVVALAACLLFICLEMLQGNRPAAVAHLRTGLRILSGLHVQFLKLDPRQGGICLELSSETEHNPLGQLAIVFARLDYEATMFGEQTPVLALIPVDNKLSIPKAFASVAEAKQSLDLLANSAFRFRGELLRLAALENGDEFSEMDLAVRHCLHYSKIRTVNLCHHPTIQEQHDSVLTNLARWSSAFKALSVHPLYSYARPTLLLEIQQFYLHFLISTIRDTHEQPCDRFVDTFKRIVSLSEKFVDGVAPSNYVQSSYLPGLTFTLESGIIPAMYITSVKCRDRAVRHAAISLLQSTTCQEGMWEGALIARFMEGVAELEEKAAKNQTGKDAVTACDIPEQARFNDVVVAASERPGCGRLVDAHDYNPTGASSAPSVIAQDRMTFIGTQKRLPKARDPVQPSRGIIPGMKQPQDALTSSTQQQMAPNRDRIRARYDMVTILGTRGDRITVSDGEEA
ncbi:hypothetical protein N7474_009068 [Penicillium riverlandense]|uniref:uncharacterized protein n=1 Tax=Penicillium riverlandense TaxID=1903569 RepID=UPI0025481160|nr:uncharacterized protein N7474_009068 [Penicillium riverlandense]KAJ5807799.1 hypothetical protein N7474_009068 [Penicillium riverlandense]